jgi:autotransporter adhesin
LGQGGVAIGYQALAETTGSVAIGDGAIAKSSVAVGVGARAMGLNTTAVGDRASAIGDYGVALGNQAQALGANSVALGNSSVADQDSTVSVGAVGSERRITNVAPGVQPTDAVNMSQLREVERKAYAGVAMSIAMASGRISVSEPGQKAVGVGLGSYGGNQAFSFTFQGLTETGKLQYNLGISTTGGREWSVGAGIGYRWK